MKQTFEGVVHPGGPQEWPGGWPQDRFFSPDALELLRVGNPGPFSLVAHPDYLCYEYPIKLDILSFSKFRLRLPVRVVGLPVSVGQPGYRGSLQALVNDYKRRLGLFVVLNMPKPPQDAALPCGQTLGTCVFAGGFGSMEEYMAALRSPYRRRLRRALQKTAGLTWRQVPGSGYTAGMHKLYLQVLGKSDFPLEQLTEDFFRHAPGQLYALYENDSPLAFVLLHRQGQRMEFVFGGMDYSRRDEYDLYYNMLLKILQESFAAGCVHIDFGQTAEHSKMRVGCEIEPRYMAVFCRFGWVNALLRKLVPLFAYHPPKAHYRAFGTPQGDALVSNGMQRAPVQGDGAKACAVSGNEAKNRREAT